MHRRGAQTATTRTRVLEAAVELLGEVGVEATTMPAVAERADVALRTVYNHFGSKEALVLEAYEGLADATRQAAASLPGGGAPRERIGWFLDAFYDAFEHRSPGAAAILAATNAAPEVQKSVEEVRAWRRRELTAILRPASQAGDLRMPLKQAVALAFLMTAYATWHSFVKESGLTGAVAKEIGKDALDRALFG
jgi:AcrR family transcriptional regulator